MQPASYKQQAIQIARAFGIPAKLFLGLVTVESGWNADATSPVGARGLTQLMPKTASGLGVDPADPIQNLTGGARYLRTQFDRFKSWPLALAAYNAGPNAVAEHGGIPPYRETQAYVKTIMSGVKVPAGGTPTAPGSAVTYAPATPDLGAVAFENLATHANPLESLSNLTAAVHAAGGPQTIESASPMPAGPTGVHGGPVKFTGVSLRGTNATFARNVSLAAAAVGATAIRLISAKRTPATNTGVANSNHLYGHAFDGEALINGRWVPLGVALKPVAAQFGLRSGDVPGFYKGGPDVNHVDDGYNLSH